MKSLTGIYTPMILACIIIRVMLMEGGGSERVTVMEGGGQRVRVMIMEGGGAE